MLRPSKYVFEYGSRSSKLYKNRAVKLPKYAKNKNALITFKFVFIWPALNFTWLMYKTFLQNVSFFFKIEKCKKKNFAILLDAVPAFTVTNL